MSSTPRSVGGYGVSGVRYVIGRDDTGAQCHFVQRSTMRGRPWLRFLRKLDGDGWHVSASKTLRLALDGSAAKREASE